MVGTCAKLIIKRYLKKDIHLWIPYDGQFELVGRQLCDELKTMLYKYTCKHLQKMVEGINIKDVTEPSRDITFRVADISLFIEGLTSYKNDERNDIEYIYTLDFYSETFTGEHIKTQRKLHRRLNPDYM